MTRSFLQLIALVGGFLFLTACDKVEKSSAPATVDNIKGFNLINLGDTLEHISPRLEPVSDDVLAGEQSSEFKLRKIAELQPMEQEWANFPVSKIEVHFINDFAFEIKIRFGGYYSYDEWSVLIEAFKQKYGPVFSQRTNEYWSDTWQARDTKIKFMHYSGPGEVTFHSKRVYQREKERAEAERKKRMDEKVNEGIRKL